MSGMSQETAWYRNRSKFYGFPPVLKIAEQIDEILRERLERMPGLMGHTNVLRFPQTNYGRVSWSRDFEAVNPYSSPANSNCDFEGWVMPASSHGGMCRFPDDLIPEYMCLLDQASIVDRVDGFENLLDAEKETFVYFLQGAFTGLYKIGLCSNVEQRISAIRSGCSEPLLLHAVTPGNRFLEVLLHGLFEPLQSHGEWFHPHHTIAGMALSLGSPW